jgi:hypothetical protein
LRMPTHIGDALALLEARIERHAAGRGPLLEPPIVLDERPVFGSIREWN